MRIAVGLALALLVTTPAYAQTDEARAACFTEIPLTAALIAETRNYDYGGYAGSQSTPPFVIGYLSPTRYADDAQDLFGAVLFIRDGEGQWRAMLPRVGESVVAAYANDEGGVMIATMWTSEGPGSYWMLLRSTDGLRTAACNEMTFPASLNEPVWNMDFLSLRDFDMNRSGRGEIIGSSNPESGEPLWFSYRTRDHGATWSAPQRISGGREARRGAYTRIDQEEAPEALVAELTAYAAAR